MIGIVVVSHSRALGEAVVGLAREMAGGAEAPRLAVAAGLDETTFGTDAAAVAAAIEEVASDDGVLVLVDIGSSVLSAELACEFLDPDVAEQVRISPAPLVEGIVPAVVSAASGASLAEVAEEAEEGLAAKQAHLDAGPAGLDTPPPPRHPTKFLPRSAPPDTSRGPRRSSGTQPAHSVDIVVNDPHGLHARPAAKLVALVRSFDAQVSLANLDAGGRPVSAGSLSRVATLNAGHGDRLRVAAQGPQAPEVLAAVAELADRNFDDQPPAATSKDTSRAVAATVQDAGLDAALG